MMRLRVPDASLPGFMVLGCEPLPEAYTHPTAARVRESGGVGAKTPDREAIRAYLAAVNVPAAMAALKREAANIPGLRGQYLAGLVLCFEIMSALAMEILGEGPTVSYEACVTASTGKPPEPSDPVAKRERVAELLSKAGLAAGDDNALLAAVDTWRKSQSVPMASIRLLGAAVIGHFERLTALNIAPHLPAELHFGAER